MIIVFRKIMKIFSYASILKINIYVYYYKHYHSQLFFVNTQFQEEIILFH